MRIRSGGIIIEDNYVYLFYRRKILEDGTIKEYYAIPGGGIELGETKEEAVIRELKEEFTVDVEIIKYLGCNNEKNEHFFHCRIINGIPKLGGEELERMSEKNYYEIRKVPVDSLEELDLLHKDMILKCLK